MKILLVNISSPANVIHALAAVSDAAGVTYYHVPLAQGPATPLKVWQALLAQMSAAVS
jgi:hypothetical protein